MEDQINDLRCQLKRLYQHENPTDAAYHLIDHLSNDNAGEDEIRLLTECYLILNRYAKAEELFLQAYHPSDKKDVKKLHSIRESIGCGIPPQGRIRYDSIPQVKPLPSFLYHPAPLETGSVLEGNCICSVCGDSSAYYYTGPFYTRKDYEFICPWCIADGSAAQTLAGVFFPGDAVYGVTDPSRIEMLTQKTPTYRPVQVPHWEVHCDDFCRYLGRVDWDDIVSLGLGEQVTEEYVDTGEYELEQLQEDLEKGPFASLAGELFQCVECGVYRLYLEYD